MVHDDGYGSMGIRFLPLKNSEADRMSRDEFSKKRIVIMVVSGKNVRMSLLAAAITAIKRSCRLLTADIQTALLKRFQHLGPLPGVYIFSGDVKLAQSFEPPLRMPTSSSSTACSQCECCCFHAGPGDAGSSSSVSCGSAGGRVCGRKAS